MNHSELYLSDTQYQTALRNLRDGIAQGVPLKAEDDNTPGNKSLSCSWGLCSEETRIWPDRDMHLFPDQFPSRTAPKYREKHHRCPMDRRTPEEAEKNGGYGKGCFYHCRIFRPARGEARPQRETALRLTEELLCPKTPDASAR